MYKTPEELGLSQQEINRIAEELWNKETSRDCPDCGVKVGKTHQVNCDVSHCTHCGTQYLGCGCVKGRPDVWTGIWPGVEGCYQQKLICMYSDNKWTFDLNRYYSKK